MLKNEVVQTMPLNIKFSYLAENSNFSRSNSYFSILTPTFLRDGFLNSYFQNPSENSESESEYEKRPSLNASTAQTKLKSLQKSFTASLKNEYQYIKNICYQ